MPLDMTHPEVERKYSYVRRLAHLIIAFDTMADGRLNLMVPSNDLFTFSFRVLHQNEVISTFHFRSLLHIDGDPAVLVRDGCSVRRRSW